MTSRRTPARGRARRTDGDGFALVMVLIVTLLLTALAGALHFAVLGESRLRGALSRSTAGFYAAEAGINRGMGEYRNIFLSYKQPTGADFAQRTVSVGDRTVRYKLTERCTGGCPLDRVIPAGQPFAGLRSQLYRYVAESTSELTAGDIETRLGTQFDVNYIPLFQFLAFYERDLEIRAGPYPMTLNGPIHTNGALYLSPVSTGYLRIEDNPPAVSTVSVTARGSIYRGRKDAQLGTVCSGTVAIDALADGNKDGSLDPRTMACTGSGATSQTDAMLGPWLGAIRARQPYVAVPEPDVLNVGSGEYWDAADLRLALDLNAKDANGRFPIVVLTQGLNVDAARTARLQAFMSAAANYGRVFYNDVPLAGQDGLGGSGSGNHCTGNSYCNKNSYEAGFAGATPVYGCPGSDLGLYDACAANERIVNEALSGGGITQRRGGFYNNREKAWVYMLNVNLHDLLRWNRAQPGGSRLIDNPDDATEGGLVIFLTVIGPNATGNLPNGRRYGVRVFGSPNLDFGAAADPTGVTVVSDQAIYVEGQYNLAAGQGANGVVFDAAHPKQPAAFLGDTINVLSAAWSGDPDAFPNDCRNDCQSRRSVDAGQRPASQTWVNAAFMGGVDDTVVGSSSGYNGGFENYPRMHEDWSGVNFNYRGSFVSLGVPRRSNGRWCGTGGNTTNGCNIYTPPGRPWNYDTDFQQVANLPPLTPRVVSVEQILFSEAFR